MRKGDWRAIILMIMFSQILFLWLIDVSIPAMMFNAVGTKNGFGETVLTNGWIVQNPLVMYHVAMGWMAFSSFLMALVAIHHIDGEKT